MNKYSVVAIVFLIIGVPMLISSFFFFGGCASYEKQCYVSVHGSDNDVKISCSDTYSYSQQKCARYENGENEALGVTLLTFGMIFVIFGLAFLMCQPISYDGYDGYDDDGYGSYY